MSQTKTETHLLAPDGGIPNNRWPLIVHRTVLAENDRNPESCARLFRQNGWQGTWLNGVFSYWHYHAASHEALGCVAGTAEVGFGGDNGVVATFSAGDVVIIPAGVGHKRLSASSDFLVVGCYPPGQSGAISRPGDADPAGAIATANAVPAPSSDPLFGREGGIVALWH